MALAFESPPSQIIPKMDGGFQRPQSALARGVHITELTDGCTNPEPIVMQETDILMEQYLSATKLQALTGCDDLSAVTSIELKVDTTETSLNNFGSMLPNLTVLKLSGSVIPNIRDLGSSLRQLEVLWMSRCALEELDGVSSMLSLRELYLPYNEIADLSPLTMLEELQILDLEGNNVDDVGQIQYLTLCSKLRHLTLDGNPICVTPTVHAEEVHYDYRHTVKQILPELSILDDKPLTDRDTGAVQNVFDADWAYLEELQKDALVIESINSQEDAAVSSAGRPTTAALKPATAYRPGSALRPSSGYRPMSSHRRPASISGGRPSSAWTEGSKQRPASSDAVEGMESSSDLTSGVIICGNPSKALRSRRSPSSTSQESLDQPPLASPSTPSSSAARQASPQASSVAALAARAKGQKESMKSRGGEKKKKKEEEEEEEEKEGGNEAGSTDERDLRLLMEELQSWKMEHEKRLEKIRESKAPQVFTIDHDSSHSVDPSDDDDDDDLDLDLDPSSNPHRRRHPDNNDDLDLDLRPDSAMDRYRHQQAERSSWQRRKPAIADAATTNTAGNNSVRDADPSTKNTEAATRSRVEQKRPPLLLSEQGLKDYERSMDHDQHLLQEYQRPPPPPHASSNHRREGAAGEAGHQNRGGGVGELRELRVPSAGGGGPLARPHSPRRGVSPKPGPVPFPNSSVGLMSSSLLLPAEGSLSPGRESPYREQQQQRPRKIRIGPTGLPGSSHGQQPQIRDVLTPAAKGGSGKKVFPNHGSVLLH